MPPPRRPSARPSRSTRGRAWAGRPRRASPSRRRGERGGRSSCSSSSRTRRSSSSSPSQSATAPRSGCRSGSRGTASGPRLLVRRPTFCTPHARARGCSCGGRTHGGRRRCSRSLPCRATGRGRASGPSRRRGQGCGCAARLRWWVRRRAWCAASCGPRGSGGWSRGRRATASGWRRASHPWAWWRPASPTAASRRPELFRAGALAAARGPGLAPHAHPPSRRVPERKSLYRRELLLFSRGRRDPTPHKSQRPTAHTQDTSVDCRVIPVRCRVVVALLSLHTLERVSY
uniref:Uncharacterized protein n=1 Tax=Emiliania huxleyi (strain CCMP1516) TaxID=280463 RepID=A0A0D3KNP5_EMIH1